MILRWLRSIVARMRPCPLLPALDPLPRMDAHNEEEVRRLERSLAARRLDHRHAARNLAQYCQAIERGLEASRMDDRQRG